MITAVLSRYPAHIAEASVHALGTTSKWLPTVSEVRQECERRDIAEQDAVRRAAQAEQQLQERREYEATRHQPRHSDEEIEAIVEAIKRRTRVITDAKHSTYQSPTDDELRALYPHRKAAGSPKGDEGSQAAE